MIASWTDCKCYWVGQVRRQVLGPGAPPLLVVGPRPLRRALHAYAQLEPLTFVYLDNAATLVGSCCPTL